MKRTPITAYGKRRRQKQRWHTFCRDSVIARARWERAGLCEGCGERPGTEWAHLFGRGNVISEPWCSLSELTAWLCRPCHDAVDRRHEQPLSDRLRWAALGRLELRWPALRPVLSGREPLDGDPFDVVRAAERMLPSVVQLGDLPLFAPAWKEG